MNMRKSFLIRDFFNFNKKFFLINKIFILGNQKKYYRNAIKRHIDKNH